MTKYQIYFNICKHGLQIHRLLTFIAHVGVVVIYRAENDGAIVQLSYSGGMVECCVLVLHAFSGLGQLCSRPNGSYLHHQLEAE